MVTRPRHFDNTFIDYNAEVARTVVSSYSLHSESKIVCAVEPKWEKTLERLQQIDNKDTSVYTGTSGIALLKLLKNPHDVANLEEAKRLLSLRKLKSRKHSFLCGDAGPLAIGAVIAYRLGKLEEVRELVTKLTSMSDLAINYKSDLPNEYLYGRAGYLFALLYVNKNIEPPPIPGDVIREVIDAILITGKNESRIGKFKCPLMYQWHDSYYLGAAHGLSGILYMLLQAREYLTDIELNTLIKPTIEYLVKLRYPSGNYPSSLGSENDKYVQWCHGAPGFLYLFSLAYKVFKDPNYLQLALKAGDVIWQRGLVRKGYSLCHGVSGNAYCFLELFQTTQDVKHLYRAARFAEWCVAYTKEHEEYTPDRPMSLFEGIAGPMYLLLDIQNPMEAKFPGYTL